MAELFLDRALAQLSLARAFVPFEKDDVFLDIGPGSGASFAVAKEIFPVSDLYAVELTQDAPNAYERLYKAKTFRTIDEAEKSGVRAKVIVLSHSLEHHRLFDIPAVFNELRSVLAPNGVVLIEVPLVDMRIHQSIRDEDSPHFCFFTQESMQLICEKNGYKVLFNNSCGDLYEEQGKMIGRRSKSKFIIFANKLTRKFGLNNKKIDRNISTNFCYGSNRKCLRLIITPKT